MQSPESDFTHFAAAVKNSVEGHARRKGYSTGDADAKNELADFMHTQGLGQPHGVAEILYKALEFRQSPRRVLLEKIAGWAFILWQRCD